MCPILRKPVRGVPDAGPAQAGAGGRQDRHRPRPGVREGLDEDSQVLCHARGHRHGQAGPHQARQPGRGHQRRAEER